MLKRVLAAPFKSRDRGVISKTEFVYTLSRDRGWYSPGESEELIETGLENELIKMENNGDETKVSALFDFEGVEIPDSAPKIERMTREINVFDAVLDRLMSQGLEKQEAVAEINKKHQELERAVEINAVALLVAKRKGVRVADLAEKAIEDL